MSRLGLLVVLLVTGCEHKPEGFGVNVEVKTDELDEGTRSSIARAGLHVRGAESFDKTIPDVSAAVKDGAIKFHYVPGVQAGALSFAVDGLDGNDVIVASGSASPVALRSGESVEVTLTLKPGAHNGQTGIACVTSDECITGFCVDGVCCDTACEGVCEACNVATMEGICSPVPAGTDPQMECVPKAPPMVPDDLGVDDAGNPILPDTDGGFLFPDGGGTVDYTQCGGTCNGSRACGYPVDKPCGPAFCSEAAQLAKFVCDTNGACGQTLTNCGDYACVSDMVCKADCLTNADCAPTDFCNVNSGKCVPKRDNGLACGPGYECKSGFCVGGLCCNSECASAGGMCNKPGQEGQCICSVGCDPGVGCVLWYQDSDGDGHGDQTGTVGNGRAKVGCESGALNAPPAAGFVKLGDDCDDANINAHPGQYGFFTAKRANNTWDYDCNGLSETQYSLVDKNLVANSCAFCAFSGIDFSCTSKNVCSTANSQSHVYCGFLAKCSATPTGNFQNDGACTALTNFRQCGTCSIANGFPTVTTTQQAMGCR